MAPPSQIKTSAESDEGTKLDTAAIRRQLATRLPEHPVPEHLFVLDELPLTSEGGYDLDALPDPSADNGTADNYVAPRTPMERQLTGIVEELLAIDRVGLYDSFFELGGFSLLASRLTALIREMFGVELALRDVFASPTVDELAQLIARTQAERAGCRGSRGATERDRALRQGDGRQVP